MSFILDALKKSENERKRTIGPSLADAPVHRANNDRPWWAVAVAALLIINLGVLVVVLTRKDDASTAAAAPVLPAPAPAATPPQTSTPRANPTTLPQNPNAGAPANSPAVRSLAEEAAGSEEAYQDPSFAEYDPGNPALAAAGAVPDGPPIVRPIDAPAVAPYDNRSTSQTRAPMPQGEVLPSLSSLTATGFNLPDMKLDIHVYSAQPAERFVFVNMRKYQEGQALSEGPTVERITPEGVVLNAQGTRFLLPRQ
jgi:general secretion pathway protein B